MLDNNRVRLSVIALGCLALCACTTTRQVTDATFEPPRGAYSLIVLQPDIFAGSLTAGGQIEPREDWTRQARENVLAALVKQQAERGAVTKIAATPADTGADPTLVGDLVALHNVVGQTIKRHKFSLLPLPTKKNRFDWTLGSSAVEFGKATRYDYALFLRAQDSFSSGGRQALQVASLLSCAILCILPDGGAQIAFASLVDLKTGQLVWYNSLRSMVGDMRTPKGAETLVEELLEGLQPEDEETSAKVAP